MENKVQEISFQRNIKEFKIEASINECFALTRVFQTYENHEINPLEISIEFPVSQKTIFRKIRGRLNGTSFESKLLENSKAEEKYTDSISEGNLGVLGKLKSNDRYEIFIGNLGSGEKLEMECEFIQLTSSQDLSYSYEFELLKIPKIIRTSNTINSKNLQINCRCFNNKNSDEIVFCDCIPIFFSANLNTKNKLTRISSSYNILSKIIEPNSAILELSNDMIKALNYKKIDVLFRTDRINFPILFEQFNPLKNEIAYCYSFLLDKRDINITEDIDTRNNTSYYKLYESESCLNDNPGCFTFLLDRSGSMGGEPIQIAKEALLLFLKSLPQGSKYEIIGFGSNYECLNGKIIDYTQENLIKTQNSIKKFQADLGGTNIYQPLLQSFNLEYNKNLSRNIFILTDGIVSNGNEIYDLIKSKVGEFRVHIIGIGHSVSQEFIKEVGNIGKGSYHFATELASLPSMTIKALSQALMPYYTDLTLTLNDLSEKIACYPSNLSTPLLYQDEIQRYLYVSKSNDSNQDQELILNYFDSMDSKSSKVISKKNEIICKLPNGEDLSQIILGLYINDLFGKNDKSLINEILSNSLRYQIICPLTSIFIEIKKENNTIGDLLKLKIPTCNKTESFLNYPRNRFRGRGRATQPEAVVKTISEKKDNLEKMKNRKIVLNQSSLTTCDKSSNHDGNVLKIPVENLKFEEDKSGSNAIYQEEIISDGRTLENTQENKISYTKEVSDEYEMIINSQEISGLWNLNTDFMKNLQKKYFEKFQKLVKSFENINHQKLDNLIISVIVLFHLYSEYQSKKDEFKLIVNKSKKILLMNGIKYDEAIKLTEI